VAAVLLAHPRQQEYLVVHEETEEDREHEQRDERHDQHGRLHADLAGRPATALALLLE
jgi:hypothetical protein